MPCYGPTHLGYAATCHIMTLLNTTRVPHALDMQGTHCNTMDLGYTVGTSPYIQPQVAPRSPTHPDTPSRTGNPGVRAPPP